MADNQTARLTAIRKGRFPTPDFNSAAWRKAFAVARIAQGKLLEMMEERGLGTKATRADIIQKLYDRGYVFANPPEPSETGIAMCKAFEHYVPRMATPDMTAEMEAEMDQIAAGEMTKDQVLADSRNLLRSAYDEMGADSTSSALSWWSTRWATT